MMSKPIKGHIGVYEFVRQTGISIAHVYQQIYLGKIKAVKPGRAWMIPQSEVEKHAKVKP
jgi:excisionase family DNA binding protein